MNQQLLAWLTASYVYSRLSDEQRAASGLQQPQGIGYGIGLAFAIFAMQGELWPLLSSHANLMVCVAEISSLVCICTSSRVHLPRFNVLLRRRITTSRVRNSLTLYHDLLLTDTTVQSP